MTIFFQDLKEEVQQEIIDELKERLMPEILATMATGLDRQTAEVEIVDDYINTHNFGVELNY